MIKSAQDYYPFGMLMPNRNGAVNATGNFILNGGETYRFGFNGQEKDDEVSGSGNTNTALYWEYDTRLGRRWNLDPKPNASNSEYLCFYNNSILYNDLSGDTVQISFRAGGFLGLRKNTVNYNNGKLVNRNGTEYSGPVSKFAQRTLSALNKLDEMPIGENALNELIESKNVFNICRSFAGNSFSANSIVQSSLALRAPVGTPISGSGGTIYFNPYKSIGPLDTRGSINRPAYIGLGHELLGHGLDANRGTTDYTPIAGQDFSVSENFATHVENQLRAEHWLPLRTFYGRDLSSGKGFYPLINDGKSLYYDNYDYYGARKMKIIKVTYIQ